jgi:serine/threonine-protein kinase RsbW
VARRRFPAKPGEVARVVAFVAGLVGRAGLAADQAIRLELAVEEWVVNLCTHAYAGRDGEIEVAVRKGNEELLIEIIDDGPPFDPTSLAEPNVALPLDQREPGGLGHLLIRRMTDKIGYARDGGRNIITLAVALRQS